MMVLSDDGFKTWADRCRSTSDSNQGIVFQSHNGEYIFRLWLTPAARANVTQDSDGY